MVLISSLDQIIAALPDVKEIGGELHSPCPFCNAGTDRFFWQENYQQFYCRHCGRHSIEEVAQRLFGDASIIASEFLLEIQTKPVQIKRELVLYDEAYIEILHADVLMEYWRSFNWSFETIERFQLGFGQLYPNVEGRADRHIIPFVPRTETHVADGYALEGRLEHPYRNEPKNIKTAGVTREYFTEIVEGDSSFAYICEGLKDALSAYEIGFRHIYCFFGNATNLDSFSKYISEKQYDSIVLFSHNDEAGDKYRDEIQEHLSIYTCAWPTTAKRGYDLTNLLESYGAQASLYITQNLTEFHEALPRGYIEDVREFLPDYVAPDSSATVTLEQAHQELPEVLDDFIKNYKEKRHMAGRGIVKVLGADPGSGKSYALVQMAEKLARRALEEFQIEARALDSLIEDLEQEQAFVFDLEALEEHKQRIENFRKRRENLSCATILYSGPFITGWQDILDQGADPTLWYNYQARNEENCENLYTVQRLASKGYVPMAYCQAVCPLKSHCEVHGYLSQERERRSHPITYVRHQQLITAMVQEYKYIIIDENCLSVFDTPTIISARELIPTYEYWDTNADSTQVKLILELVEALRNTLKSAEEERVYSGRDVMDRINEHLLGKLVETLKRIDPKCVMDFQPKTVMQGIDTQSVPIRCLPGIYQALLSELPLYESDTINYNSGLHIVDRELEVYSLERLHIPSNRPVIVSDGTPLPQLYGLLFDREVEIYSPAMYNPQSQTIVYTGSDFTITSIRKQLGDSLRDFQRWLMESERDAGDLYGEEFDLDSIPYDENIYASSIMRRALTLLKMTAERHTSLLFVTYKPIRILLEKRIKELHPDLYERIRFAHYWSLRGTNRYKDVEAVLLLGCPRIPYDRLYRRIQAWAKLAEIRWISPEIQMRISPYFGEFRYDGYTHPNFNEFFANSFLDMVEAGEIRQSQERIRQHTSANPKIAYLAMSRPAAKWVTSVERVGGVVNQYESDTFRNAYQELLNCYLTTQTFPSYTSISKKYKLSNRTIANIKRSILSVNANQSISN